MMMASWPERNYGPSSPAAVDHRSDREAAAALDLPKVVAPMVVGPKVVGRAVLPEIVGHRIESRPVACQPNKSLRLCAASSCEPTPMVTAM